MKTPPGQLAPAAFLFASLPDPSIAFMFDGNTEAIRAAS